MKLIEALKQIKLCMQFQPTDTKLLALYRQAHGKHLAVGQQKILDPMVKRAGWESEKANMASDSKPQRRQTSSGTR